MKTFFDTSVLIAAVYEDHLRHRQSLDRIVRDAQHAVVAAQALGEMYATLTGKLRKPPEEVYQVLQDLSRRFQVVELTADEYSDSLSICASMGISGGAAYIALQARCAIKAGATVLYTWNVREFMRLGDDVARIVRMP